MSTAFSPASHAPAPSGRRRVTGSQIAAHVAMLFFAAFVAGTFSVGALVADKVGPAAFNALRFCIGSIIVGVVACFVLQGRMRWLPKTSWRHHLLGALMAAFMVTMFFAFEFTSPVSTSAVFMLVPLMSAFFGYLFLGQKPPALVLASLLLAGAGAAWVIFHGNLDALLAFDLGQGEAIFLFGCACHAAYAPLARRMNRGEPVLAFTFFTLVATGLCLGVYGARELAFTEWHKLPVFVWIALFYLTIFATAGTFFLLQFASMELPASKVFSYAYLIPVFVIVYEGLAGRGGADTGVVAGAAVTVLGLAILVLSPDPVPAGSIPARR